MSVGTHQRIWLSKAGAIGMALFVASALSCGRKGGPGATGIRIGAPLSLTGSAAVWGQKSKNGIELAVQHLAEQGIKVDVVFEDTRSDSKSAVTVLNKLISQ
ncbi:ABC transporter substrate-binding protein, partial [Thermoanaerobaculum aquaticum]|uniref:ABC transporter substrate-binding protein n=1 Tax=Thermoanaerobaculum aquaticum TaxID=1312852 RepID=UPI001378A01E